MLVAGLVLAASLAARRLRGDPAGTRTAAVLALGGVLSVVASPITWTHHLGWLFPAAALLLGRSGPAPARAAGALLLLPTMISFYSVARSAPSALVGDLVAGTRSLLLAAGLLSLVAWVASLGGHEAPQPWG